MTDHMVDFEQMIDGMIEQMIEQMIDQMMMIGELKMQFQQQSIEEIETRVPDPSLADQSWIPPSH